MDDIICIFHLSDGKEWARYLQERLMSDKYQISAMVCRYGDTAATKYTKAKLNILLITPEIIESKHLNLRDKYSSVTSIAVLAGVDHDGWIAAKEALRLETELRWFIYELESEPDSVRDLMVFIVSLYESIGSQYPTDTSSMSSDTETETVKDNRETIIGFQEIEKPKEKELARPDSGGSDYDQLPPPRPINTISHIFQKSDQIYLVLEGANSGSVEIKFRETGQSVAAARVSEKATLYCFSYNRSNGTTFNVILDGEEVGEGELETEMRSRSVSQFYETRSFRDSEARDSALSMISDVSTLSRISDVNLSDRNPSRLSQNAHQYISSSSSHFVDPARLSYSSGVSSGSSVGAFSLSSSESSSVSKLDQLYRLLKDVSDPVSILCQSLGVKNGVSDLDEKLSQMLESPYAAGVTSFRSIVDAPSEPRDSIWPTLLHFGAYFGLWKVSLSLVNNQLTKPAAVVRNMDNCFPHDIARQKGHIELAATLKQVFEDLMNKNGNRESLVSLESLEYQGSSNLKTPPPIHQRTSSTKSTGSDEEFSCTRKGILKRTSTSSVRSEDDYDTISEPRRHRDDSISSADSLRVTFNPRFSDDEKTPVPYMADLDKPPFPNDQGQPRIRTSNPLEIPKTKNEDDAITRQKDIAEYMGSPQLSSSVPSSSYITDVKKESHSFLDRFRKPRTPPKSTFNNRESDSRGPEGRHAHTGEKAKVYRHKKGHHEDRDSSPEEEQQFRSRLQTYPLPGQVLRKPNVKKLKEKHATAVKELASSTSDLTATPHKDGSYVPDVALRHKQDNKKESHSGKKKRNEKEHHKSRIDRIIHHASKRTSIRFHVAQNDDHKTAPALPPRQNQYKNLGKF